MTRNELIKVRRLIRHINAAQKLADELELLLSNGAEAGSVLGSIADEFEIKLEGVEAK